MANWLVFAGLGPPLGLASLIIYVALADGGFPYETLVTVVALGLPACYALGLVPALVSAFAIRQVQMWRIRYEVVWVALVGTFIGILYVTATSGLFGEDLVELGSSAVAAHLLSCLIPTLICWRLSKAVATDRAPSA